MPMTSDAKRALATTIRSLRERLLAELHDATESEYRLSVRARDAGLAEAVRVRRGRLEAWLAEQLRAQNAGRATATGGRSAEDFRCEAEKQAAYTLLNRLVLLRLMEAPSPSGRPLRALAVVTGGWESRAYKDFRQLAPGLVRGDETEGYAFLLQLVFEDLATELPGLYGPAGVADLVPVPAATLRHVVDALNAPELESCWTDDMTLGWVYQYWNDPEREALDAKLNGGGKVEPHEIASKTQMFTERYMVDWLLQNSLGPMWLAMCKKHGWIPEVEADGTLDALEARRVEWRAKREAGEVELTALMPLYNDAERRWAYYVPQPIPDDAVVQAPDSVRDLKLIDPAVGSGHFLVEAFDLLVALYREEARHRGEAGTERWTDRAIVERILGYNLHGIDLDPRAVQIAAAALWLKARQVAPDARPERINLVASNLRLASLPDDDPALIELRREVERETGIPAALTDTLVHALRGADHLGSLLKIDHAVDQALSRHEAELSRGVPTQGDFFASATDKRQGKTIGRDEARATLLDRIEAFLSKHTSGDDLGLRLRGEQLAAGVRFVRMAREGTYDIVVANPPYLGRKRATPAADWALLYPNAGSEDLYTAFLVRAVSLLAASGRAALLGVRSWMFLEQYQATRSWVTEGRSLTTIGDIDRGGFESLAAGPAGIAVAMVIVANSAVYRSTGRAVRAFQPTDISGTGITDRRRAGLLVQLDRFDFDQRRFASVPGNPFLYHWTSKAFSEYEESSSLGSAWPVKYGSITGDDVRFLRRPFEVAPTRVLIDRSSRAGVSEYRWSPYIKGADGSTWFEPLTCVVRWESNGVEAKVRNDYRFRSFTRLIQNESYNYLLGVAFTATGANFGARAHIYASVMGAKGRSVYAREQHDALCLLNSSEARRIASDLNPTIDFNINDVKRLPARSVATAAQIFTLIKREWLVHESHREPSVEFGCPGPTPWRHAQDWGQAAVDRPEGTLLPEYVEELDPEPPTDHMSFALGVALGRFGANGEGILDPATADLSYALPDGILFLDSTLDAGDHRDGLGHPAAGPLHAAWAKYGSAIGTKRALRDWFALDFFKDVHKGMYENRPIHWPLSSSDKTFVAWVNIHRFTEQTLRVLLADHLMPTLTRLEGELNDLRAVRDSADKKVARAAEKQFDRVLKAKEELQTFIANVEQCADRGAPPTDNKCPAREQDARYAPDLDDGVMINSAALWPLLDPQWKDPKKWWKELATAKGRKDYDWSHLAMRYWPKRVDEKCQDDPSYGVAHGCFWRYHPDRAWAWELRLQDEIGPDFRIEEAPYQPGGRDLGDAGDRSHRDAWLRDHPDEALAAIEKESVRRMGRGKNRKLVPEMRILEAGLWTAHAADLWEMELRLSERQGSELRVLAPDEPEARAVFEAEYPERVAERLGFLAMLAPPELFEDDEEDADEDDVLNDLEEDEEVEP